MGHKKRLVMERAASRITMDTGIRVNPKENTGYQVKVGPQEYVWIRHAKKRPTFSNQNREGSQSCRSLANNQETSLTNVTPPYRRSWMK